MTKKLQQIYMPPGVIRTTETPYQKVS